MYRIYNTKTKQFYAGSYGWNTRGKVYTNKGALKQSITYRNTSILDNKDLWVYEYADDGTRTIHYDLKTFFATPTKKDRKRTPFNVYFVDGEMQGYVWRDQIAETVDGLSTFDDLLVLDKMDHCRSGTGAWFTGMTTGKKYYALPSAFMEMIPSLLMGTISGTFGYVNRGQYSKGIKLLSVVKPKSDLPELDMAF